MKEIEINFCNAFLEKVIGRKGIENKARYLLEDFFYDEGWSSMTSKEAMKKGKSQDYTYSKSSIAHFVEDFVRLFEREWEIEWQKVMEHIGKFQIDEKECVILTKKEYDKLKKEVDKKWKKTK